MHLHPHIARELGHEIARDRIQRAATARSARRTSPAATTSAARDRASLVPALVGRLSRVFAGTGTAHG